MKKAVMYGAGNIGRGFIAQLFYQSGYETVFIDVNDETVTALNRDRAYPIYITAGDHYEVFHVTNVRAVNGMDENSVANEIASADICATAVGVNALKHIARPVALGIEQRRFRKAPPLNIIVCENLLDADKYFHSLLSQYLDESLILYLNNNIGIAEASVGRMVPSVPESIRALNQLAVCVEPYCELPVDRAGLKGDIPEIINLLPFEPFDFFIRRKLFMHNMSHALIAYLGYIKGYKYIWEAAADYKIRYETLSALLESASALSLEYNEALTSLIKYAYDLLDRFDNKLLADTVERVGRDTIRKLSANDRIAGAVTLCIKHDIKPRFIMRAAAAALHFKPEDDIASVEVASFAVNNGISSALARYSGINDFDIVADIKKIYDDMVQ